ncbi:MAG: transposase, partial [Pseudomonadota bacterium]
MSKQPRRRFTPEFKEQAVARVSAPGATQSSVAKELGVTATQRKTWRLELEAAGSAAAMLRQKAEVVSTHVWMPPRGRGAFRRRSGEIAAVMCQACCAVPEWIMTAARSWWYA